MTVAEPYLNILLLVVAIQLIVCIVLAVKHARVDTRLHNLETFVHAPRTLAPSVVKIGEGV